MRVILMRHAEAVTVGTNGVTDDFDRHLTAHGRRQAAAVAAHVGQTLTLDAILCSPFRRARETAEALKSLLPNGGEVIVADELASESGNIDGMAAALASTGSEVVAAVGHMPDIAFLCRWLVGGDLGTFETAQAVCIRFDNGITQGAGRVEWAFVPRV